LITSTLLTLIVIPTIYALLDGAVAWIFRSRVQLSRQATGALGEGDADSVTP
jgi:hypothetical protein